MASETNIPSTSTTDIPPPSPPVSPQHIETAAMANLVVDPARWVPLGMQIIDGGPNRLPRTFYNPSVMPPRHNDNVITTIMMPPPEEQEDAWREQVRLFIVQHLQRAVDDVQPCLFGLGFYRLRSAAATISLLNHGPYELQLDVFVRFVNHNDRQNHRAFLGFRQGWIMILSVPLDFCNDYDIANAISAFGKFHHWHQEDGVLEILCCFVSFNSTAQVPRDIVFGNYGNLGAVKES
jgi:hypothetical protein